MVTQVYHQEGCYVLLILFWEERWITSSEDFCKLILTFTYFSLEIYTFLQFFLVKNFDLTEMLHLLFLLFENKGLEQIIFLCCVERI